MRLSALSKHPVIYIMTHDSIGLGEDGPTHQPIETLAGIRAMPNIIDFRPADGNEVSASYIAALENNKRPSVLIFSRQNLPNLAGSSIEKALCGAYIVQPAKDARLILVATGSEVSLACESADALEKTHGVPATVVSMPSWRLFDEQPLSYKQTVFPQGIPVVSVEAMSTLGWQKYAHYAIGVDAFGKSAPYLETYKYFGLVPSVIAEKAWKISNHYSKNTPEWKMQSDPCL